MITAPIRITGGVPVVITDQSAETRRNALLAESREIEAVKNPLTYEQAGTTVADLKRIKLEVEKSRKAVKAPVIELGRRIDAAADAFLAGIPEEIARVGSMLVAYDQEQARIRAEAERKAREEAERAERARREAEAAEARRIAEQQARERAEEEAAEAAMVAKATADSAAKADAQVKAREAAAAETRAIQAEQEARRAAFAAETQQAQPPAPIPAQPPRVTGLRLRQVQCHKVDDVRALFAARPDLVQLVPIAGAINKALEAGENLPGVTGWKEGRA